MSPLVGAVSAVVAFDWSVKGKSFTREESILIITIPSAPDPLTTLEVEPPPPEPVFVAPPVTATFDPPFPPTPLPPVPPVLLPLPPPPPTYH
jgi:hypothetical protein